MITINYYNVHCFVSIMERNCGSGQSATPFKRRSVPQPICHLFIFLCVLAGSKGGSKESSLLFCKRIVLLSDLYFGVTHWSWMIYCHCSFLDSIQ